MGILAPFLPLPGWIDPLSFLGTPVERPRQLLLDRIGDRNITFVLHSKSPFYSYKCIFWVNGFSEQKTPESRQNRS